MLLQSRGEFWRAVVSLCGRVEEAGDPSELVLESLALQELIDGAGRVDTTHPVDGLTAHRGQFGEMAWERFALPALPASDRLLGDAERVGTLSLGLGRL